MKIALIAPMFNLGKRLPETPSRALLILGTLAKQAGHEVKILHQDIDDIDWNWKPDVVAITVNTFQLKSAIGLAMLAKLNDAKVIIGGPHAGYWRQDKDGPVDKVVVGEGENAFLEFIGSTPYIKSIDDIPMPDYSLVDMSKFSGISPVGTIPSVAIMASRGCPFQCTFCNTPIFWGRKVRYRDPEKVLDEVQHLHDKYGVNEIFFQDDTFNANHEWAFKIFDGIVERKLNKEMLFKIDCRVNEKLFTDEFLHKAKKAGVWNIFFGIESGSQYMLDRMKKGITIDEIRRAIKMTNDIGIMSQCSFVVGMPGESLRTLAETDQLINEIKPSMYGHCFACPFPGTELDKEVTVKGYKWVEDWTDYCYGSVYCRTDDLSYAEIQAFPGFSYKG
jgi:anaerobic magnesium-protoporphyrin IX monomethyl ester cyclase